MPDLLPRNLAALRRHDPDLAQRLEQAASHPGLVFEPARQEGALTATVESSDDNGRTRRITLASRHRPLEEANRFAESADMDRHAVLVVMGLGAAHHVAALARRAAGKAVVVVYEPDETLARGVMQHIDCTDWLATEHVTMFVGPEIDMGRLTSRLERVHGLVAQGMQILTHPPTRQMHAEALQRFSELIAQFAAYSRTTVATTLVHSAITCRNLAHNLGRYSAGATINELHNAAAGFPAVLVAAGPSLARNVQLLAQPGMRDRTVIIAAQTVLKPLLDRGIRPHFVTALDYHEISRRFYDDLPSLPDVTLVAEPKANKAILDHYPGPVRVCRSQFLDTLLGPLKRPVMGLPAGATVAHLSLYLAQFLGCDPILMIGQDLGFSDGLYYLPGVAIEDVWEPELSIFNTVEMMQWKRVARHKSNLRKLDDVHGKPIYSDEQMVTYLRQFERDFAAAPQQIIDCTEGGLPKQHTQRMTLAETLQAHAVRPLPRLPAGGHDLDSARLAAVVAHLQRRVEEVRQLASTSRQTIEILEQMLKHQRNRRKMDALFERIETHKKRVEKLHEAFALVNELNQVGAFNRQRADRAICVADDVDAFEVQRRRLERDIQNVNWLIQGCEQTLEIFGEAAGRIEESRRAVDKPPSITEAAA